MNIEPTDRPDLVRDTSTGAIINRNAEALVAYKKRKAQARKVQELDNRMSNIEQSVSEIHSMLSQLMEQNKV